MLRRVTGESMLPALAPGSLVVAVRTRRVSAGDVIVFRHEGLEKIKRVQAVRPGAIFVAGDNAAQSTDSRSFGWIESSTAAGKVLWPKTHTSIPICS